MAYTRVQLTIEIPMNNYGDQCTIAQAREQSAEEAKNKIAGWAQKLSTEIRVVGEPKVLIFVQDGKGA